MKVNCTVHNAAACAVHLFRYCILNTKCIAIGFPEHGSGNLKCQNVSLNECGHTAQPTPMVLVFPPATHPPFCLTELNFSLLGSRLKQKRFKESYLILIRMTKYSINRKKNQ